jgi:transmembrane sensor
VAVLERRPDGRQTSVAMGPSRTPVDATLKPGQEIILPEQVTVHPAAYIEAPVRVAAADPVRSLSWEAGQLTFEDDPLGVVAERMNRYSEKPLTIADEATARVRISGVFRAGDIDALLQGLDAAFNVKARQGATSITLIKVGADKPAA